jgi:2-polyprenyl-6-methoxyphenol hydroxylase-like FAD-dependent oxidoreductase
VDAADRAVARVGMRALDPGSVEIMRGDLVALLREVTDAEILFGDSIRGLEQDDDGVTVAFEKAPARRFDLVAGADGMHSHVRRLAFGAEDEFVRHKDHYFAFANARVALGEDRWVTMFNTPGRMAGIYRSGNHAQAKAYFAFRSAPLDYDHRDPSVHKRLVSDAFSDQTSWRTRELLDSAPGGRCRSSLRADRRAEQAVRVAEGPSPGPRGLLLPWSSFGGIECWREWCQRGPEQVR